MKVNELKIDLPGLHQCHVLTNENWEINEGNLVPTGKSIIVLLHGYSESAVKIYKRIGRGLSEKIPEASIIALNGLYPLPKHFPLDSTPKDDEELISGFAWYFFDQRKNEFLIDYHIPVQTICSYLNQINSKKLPTSFIGYSQGGYLAPFVGLSYPFTSQVLGINCSFRFDIIKEKFQEIPFALNEIQGSEDQVIDTQLCSERFKALKEHFQSRGEFQWVEGNHWLDPRTRDAAIELFLNYYKL